MNNSTLCILLSIGLSVTVLLMQVVKGAPLMDAVIAMLITYTIISLFFLALTGDFYKTKYEEEKAKEQRFEWQETYRISAVAKGSEGARRLNELKGRFQPGRIADDGIVTISEHDYDRLQKELRQSRAESKTPVKRA